MEVKLPPLGEKIEEATVSFWYRQVGEEIARDEDLVEMATEKTSFNLPAPAAGRVKEIRAGEGAVVKVGEVLAVIE